MKEIKILEIWETKKENFSLKAVMVFKEKEINVNIRFNTITKNVTVEDIDCKNSNDVFMIIKEGKICLSLDKIKFMEYEL